MSTKHKFDGRAGDYTVSRPNYSVEFIDHLYRQYGLSAESVIADIGSGTGKFSKHLLNRESKVYCVEPNRDMRLVAENELCKYANFHCVAVRSADTTLQTSKRRKRNFIGEVERKITRHLPRGKKKCVISGNTVVSDVRNGKNGAESLKTNISEHLQAGIAGELSPKSVDFPYIL